MPSGISFYSRCRFFFRSAERSVRDAYRRIGNLFYWLPVVWEDRDESSSFMLRILKHKLRSMQGNMFSEHITQLHPDWGEVVLSLDDCQKAIDRILKDEYEHSELLEYDGAYSHLLGKNGGEQRLCNLHHLTDDPDLEVASAAIDAYLRVVENAAIKREEDISSLFKVIAEKYDDWGCEEHMKQRDALFIHESLRQAKS